MKQSAKVDNRPSIETVEEIVEVEMEIVDDEFVENIATNLRLALDRHRYTFLHGDISDQNQAWIIATVKRKINETVNLIDKGVNDAVSRRLLRSSKLDR